MADKPPTIEALMKDGALVSGDDPVLDMIRVSSGLPQLDALVGGGFVYGRSYLFVGPEATGKTLLAQYVAAGIQKADKQALYVDTELSYDRRWWETVGVDVSKLLVSQPTTAERAIDIIRAALALPDMGCIILDSIAGMTPAPRLEASAENRTMGLLAQAVSVLYQTIVPVNRKTVFIAINQLRDNMTGYDDVYPGGRMQKHMSQVILRTRREGWILEGGQRAGYNMEVLDKKDKTGGKQQETITIPVRFHGAIDLLASYVDEAVEKHLIASLGGPWYMWGEEKFMGKPKLRQLFIDNPEQYAILKEKLGV